MHTRSVTFARLADVHERMLDSNIGLFSPLSDGHFVVVWWNIGNGYPEILLARGVSDALIITICLRLICAVITMYSKTDGQGAKHEWVDSSQSLGTLSYVAVQIFAHMFGSNYGSIACHTLSCETFAHVPQTHVVVALGSYQTGIKTREVTAQDGTEYTEATVSSAVRDLLTTLESRRVDVNASIRELCVQEKRKNPAGTQDIPSAADIEEDSEDEGPGR